MECIETLKKELKTLKQEKEVVDGKLAGLLLASKDLDNLIESQRPSPTVESSSEEDQNINPSASENVASPITPKTGSSQIHIDDKGFWDSGCSRHMTGNISYLFDFEPFDGGYVSFGQGGCKITRKGTIKTCKLEFENVYFVKDLKYNLFSVSQICDYRNSVLFTDSECIVLGRDFKLLDDTNILLRTPRHHNMYSIDLNNIVPHRDLTCLVAKTSADECYQWHRRLGHLNFKTMNKLVRHNLVRGLPTKCFENDHNCSACLKGKQHKASCKSKLVTTISKPQHTLHMDLFGPTSGEHNSDFHPMVDFLEASPLRRNLKLRDEDEISSLPNAELFENLTLMGYNISPNQKFTFQKGEACPTDSGFIADQDRATIAKSSTLPHDSAPRVTSPIADEGRIAATRSGNDAPIKGRSMDEGEAATKRISDDTEEMETVLTPIDAATVLAGGIDDVPTGSGSIPTAADILTGSEVVPTASLVFATATVVTPYSKRKGKEVMVESDTPKKQRLQEQIDAQLKSSEEVVEEAKSTDEIPKEKIKEMMQLIPIEEVYVEALQVKHPIIDWKVHKEGQRSYWKIIRLGGSSACYQVHQVTAKDKEIFMLVEKDYPLKKGLALVMICYKLQVENFSQMANDLVLKIYKIANSPRQQGD
uniref:Putative ribonuclease H-like domain-containing protein n=1 Tax=Tanacetum cinerariifolium TaxID=118510 RepID=A0A6L2MAY1_TANCI|nr:putative ribonuclease H-like domain-containing protein [Tanacetum cinerariifolium]